MENLIRLKTIIDQLRSPGGCPWDLEQTRESLRPYLLEEAHEVSDAILSGDPKLVCEELGDLLMNIFLQARVAEEQEEFSLDRVAEEISDKLIRRHPHVFGDAVANDPEAVRLQWEQIKAEEKNEDKGKSSTIRPLPSSLPALSRADRIGKMVAEVGFDWPNVTGALDKIDEELVELNEALSSGDSREIEHEIGDLLFALSSVSRKCGIDPEAALNKSLHRFESRFKSVDKALAGRSSASLEDLEDWYQMGKNSESEDRNSPSD
ncbi:MAG: nucleoside triphosphate pyrophosphohydrolase [Planctomycetia bacterium TMED53]|nr:MAG: nucleoside triphosphate pyrophosphohydrolase [Planctomycetia bacterium TMED53]